MNLLEMITFVHTLDVAFPRADIQRQQMRADLHLAFDQTGAKALLIETGPAEYWCRVCETKVLQRDLPSPADIPAEMMAKLRDLSSGDPEAADS